jgi:survival-of-motor-neuron-related-splicing factor 30
MCLRHPCSSPPSYSQVNIVLEKDPTNAECLSLKGELVNLITLTKDFLAQTGSSKQTNPSGDNKESSLDPSNNHSTKNSRSGSRIPNEQDKLAKSQGASNQTDALKSLNAGDLCMAKYAGDGKYYPAKITT